MKVSLSGNFDKAPYTNFIDGSHTIHKVLTKGTLVVGRECNDGRPITESWKYKKALSLGIPIVQTQKKKKPIIEEKTECNKKPLLVDKYTPKTPKDIIGHKEQISQIANWLQSWETARPEMRGILLSGPPGVGKTTTAHIVAKQLGYEIAEYNASDSRSISTLRGMFALGIKRLRKEVIIMDEVDGLSERGGVGEIASIIKKSSTPIICISNEKPPKLKPIINACIDIRFSRPVKSTIATALYKIAQKEGIEATKDEIETLCEKNGNDIRSILNNLQFYGSADTENKDQILRTDLFSATQRLMASKRMGLDDAAQFVFVDYNMVPLMVSECYLASSKGELEDAVRAAEFISNGDLMDRRIHSKHDWSLLPHLVQTTVAVSKTVSGPAPFQIFPQWLGKNSKRLKHRRLVEELSRRMRMPQVGFRLDNMDSIQHILLDNLASSGDTKSAIKSTIDKMAELGLTRDDLMETFAGISLEEVEIPTKVKTAFTREYNKLYSGTKVKKVKKDKSEESEEESEEDEGDEGEFDVTDL
jgi:replication factor C subunit 1